MKQKQNSSNQELSKFHSNKTSFKQVIQKVQLNGLKEQLEKKRLASLKNRLRQEWIERIKIIPPRLRTADKENMFRATDYFNQKDTDCFKMYRHNCYKKDPSFNDIQLLFQKQTFQLSSSVNEVSRQSLVERKSYAGTSTGFHKYKLQNLKQRKFKENWKLAYRKDQINVLRFSTGSSKQNKMQKTGDIGRILCAMIEGENKDEIAQQAEKMMYKKLVNFQKDEDEKQNVEIKPEQKNEEKRFKFNVKKSKTSLVLKNQVLL